MRWNLAKNFSTCPYCRHCEDNIECFGVVKTLWFFILNKFRKYNYKLKNGYIENPKKTLYRINLYYLKRMRAVNNIITFIFHNNKKIVLYFKDAYAVFASLKQSITTLIQRQQLEMQRQHVQQQPAY